MERPVTLEQKAALIAYADKHGKGWQDRLLQEWRDGTDVNALPGDHGTYLRQIRNQFGPEWLSKAAPFESE